MHPVLFQMLLYGVFGIIILFLIAMLFKGFFWPYIRVRSSFGKYILIKIRTPLRDYFKVGWVEENFVCYKRKKNTIRMVIDHNKKIFYRSLAVTWVDVDEEKNAICTVDYEGVSGFDAEKYDDLMVRAVQRPSIGNPKELIIIILCILILAGICFTVYLQYRQGQQLTTIQNMIPSLLKGVVTTATNNLA
jgi:hypothetical protein